MIVNLRAIRLAVAPSLLLMLLIALLALRAGAQGSQEVADKEGKTEDSVNASETKSGEDRQPVSASWQPSVPSQLASNSGVRPLSDTDGGFSQTRLWRPLLTNLALDQKAIWSSPMHLRLSDADWLVPLAGVTAVLLATDSSFSKALPKSPSFVSKSGAFSNFGVASLGGAAGGMYLWGALTRDDHKRETGLLSGEAAADAVAVTSVLGFAFGRQRPLAGNGGGGFWDGGTSFPSDHSAAAWAMASVIAHEYPGPLTQLLAYGLAGAVSASRVSGQEHFPSDALVGSAIGWLIGQHVYRAHHDPDLGGSSWPSLSERSEKDPGSHTGSKGSPYVPLDSWIYPAMDRLAALGYIQSEFMGLRPWTRVECARLVQEAGDLLSDAKTQPAEAAQLQEALASEFAQDLELLSDDRDQSLRVESVYTRVTEISGPPLRDSYHFGQTVINDFGRPYGQGTSDVSGFSGWASSGRFALYVRGEYQHAPGSAAYSEDVREVIAKDDDNAVQPAAPIDAVNRFDLLDTYAAMNLNDWQLSFGKQSLWWGPGQSGPLIWSDNADPVLMGRVSRTTPYELPGLLSYLGPMRVDLFFGKLAGHEFPANPLVHGEKISGKPIPQLEIGFSRTTVFSGDGYPLTLKSLWLTYFNVSLKHAGTALATDPGDRHAAVDASYQFGRWLTAYGNFYWDDAIRRTAYNPGVYFPRIPLVPKFDLRAEYVSTDVRPDPDEASQGELIYWDVQYHDSYTNKGDILGSWVGRQGSGSQFWGTYWLSPRNSVQVSYRHGWISPAFIPQGGRLDDITVSASFLVRGDMSVTASTKYEQWNIPILSPTRQTDVATSLQLTFYPRWRSQ